MLYFCHFFCIFKQGCTHWSKFQEAIEKAIKHRFCIKSFYFWENSMTRLTPTLLLSLFFSCKMLSGVQICLTSHSGRGCCQRASMFLLTQVQSMECPVLFSILFSSTSPPANRIFYSWSRISIFITNKCQQSFRKEWLFFLK